MEEGPSIELRSRAVQALGCLARKRPWDSVEQSSPIERRIGSPVLPQLGEITPKPTPIQLHHLRNPKSGDQVAVPTSEVGPPHSAVQGRDADAEDGRPLVTAPISILLDKIDALTKARDRAFEICDDDMRRNTRLQTQLQSSISTLITERDLAIKQNGELQLKLHNLKAGLRSLSAEKDEALRARDAAMKASRLQKTTLCSAGVNNGESFDLFTKALVASNGGVAPAPVVVRPGSLFNLVPDSIVQRLGLSSHFGNVAVLGLRDHNIHTNQYCRFDIKVAGVNTTIDAAVVPVAKCSSIQLGRLWVRMANLLSDLDHHTYYIPDPQGNLMKLPVELHKEATDHFKQHQPGATSVGDSMALCHATDGDDSADKVADRMMHARKDKSRLEGSVIEAGEYELKNCEADDSPTSEVDEPDLSRPFPTTAQLSRDYGENKVYPVERILAEKVDRGATYYLILWDGFPEARSTWEPRKNILDPSILDAWRRRKLLEDSGKQPSFDLVKFEKEVQRLKGNRHQCTNASGKRVGKSSLTSANGETQPYTLRQKRNSFQRGGRELEPEGSISATQTKEILMVLDQVRRTQAGSNFRAPVLNLWPECADAYTAKISNHIDLGTIEEKLRKGIYLSIRDFRDDVCLLYQNALVFNGIDHTITSAAFEVQKTILAAINKNGNVTCMDARRRSFGKVGEDRRTVQMRRGRAI
ncbi:uncharacterized protein PAC_15219 [Phialocephala subalpina]|uniref:Chromo domain-containing protein n=1 Tax=Phialocephala subalpina TaxID=576137 RepID=A0A1L7XJV6_9HELO|nr:uncharacterized protein PAC_15219 [Phialocephala subalpina]